MRVRACVRVRACCGMQALSMLTIGAPGYDTPAGGAYRARVGSGLSADRAAALVTIETTTPPDSQAASRFSQDVSLSLSLSLFRARARTHTHTHSLSLPPSLSLSLSLSLSRPSSRQ